MKRIFIGGLGRSGTTILLHALYRHGDIYAVPIETKFLVEEDGFDDLITALTSRFTPTGAAKAYRRFQELMYLHVTGLVDGKFCLQEHLPADVFEDYKQSLEDFTTAIRGDGVYFQRREPLVELTRRFIASLFDAETRRSGKEIWAEKTPTNYWRLPFLRELWPDCYFIHAVRDPRAVFLSLMERGWLPPEVGHSLDMFERQMVALLDLRRTYLNDARFIEVRLENLVENPQDTLDILSARLGIAPFDPSATLAVVQSMDRYYANKKPSSLTLSVRENERMNEWLLGPAIELEYPRRRKIL